MLFGIITIFLLLAVSLTQASPLRTFYAWLSNNNDASVMIPSRPDIGSLAPIFPFLQAEAPESYSEAVYDKRYPSFEAFVEKYNKHIPASEWNSRKMIYDSNVLKIKHLNSMNDGSDVVYEINDIADRTPEEILMVDVPLPDMSKIHQVNKYVRRLSVTNDQFPESFDYRETGSVGSVRNQGSAGSCWAFSAAGAIEGAYHKLNNELVTVSTEFMVQCDPNNCGVYGGWPSAAIDFAMRSGGAVLEDYMPYCCGLSVISKDHCKPCMARGYNKTFCGEYDDMECDVSLQDKCEAVTDADRKVKILGWKAILKDEKEMVAALLELGPLSVAIDAHLLQFYRGGIWTPKKWACGQLNHAVLVVGYGSEGGKDYWIIKNSWGTAWGEGGYFRMARGKALCGIDEVVVGAIVDKVSA